MPVLEGFGPVGSQEPRFLVLGSFPSVRSLERGEYYGHERNHFWAILGDLLGFDRALPYAERVALLSLAGIAVWDLFASCEREGSLDQDIRGEAFNPIGEFIAARPSIEGLGLNGGKASASFARHVAPELRKGLSRIGRGLEWRPPFAGGRLILVSRLPSTSPVPTRGYRRAEDKEPEWRAFLGQGLARASLLG